MPADSAIVVFKQSHVTAEVTINDYSAGMYLTLSS